jgi:halogenation protein CepH
MKKHDVIIMGGGPGGSTLAALLAKQGFDVGIFEREIYPRFLTGHHAHLP